MVATQNKRKLKKTSKIPPFSGGNLHDKKEPYKGKIVVHYKDKTREVYQKASLLRSSPDNTIWINFYERVIMLKGVESHKIVD